MLWKHGGAVTPCESLIKKRDSCVDQPTADRKISTLLPDDAASYLYRTARCMRAHRISLVQLPKQSRQLIPINKGGGAYAILTNTKSRAIGDPKQLIKHDTIILVRRQLPFFAVYTERNIG